VEPDARLQPGGGTMMRRFTVAVPVFMLAAAGGGEFLGQWALGATLAGVVVGWMLREVCEERAR
jgi:hypothetical protein